MWTAAESVARMRDCGDRPWTRVGASMPLFDLHRQQFPFENVHSFKKAYGSNGTAIFAVTLPVEESAILTIPSVPAEYSCDPSTLYPSVRQLPLCRLVFQTESIWPYPFSEASVSSLSLSWSLAPAGNRYVWTCPDDRPTATIGSSG